MHQLQPEQATLLLNGVFLPGFRNEHGITKGVIGAIPLDKGDYRPDAVSKSAMELAWHITVSEMRFMEAVANAAFDFTPRPKPDSITNSAELLDWYVPEFEAHAKKLETVPTETLLKTVDFRGLFQLPAVMYLGFIVNHTIHHRGQLSVYLRPMGAKVPAIYGESYDSAEARKTAQGA